MRFLCCVASFQNNILRISDTSIKYSDCDIVDITSDAADLNHKKTKNLLVLKDIQYK